MGIKDELGRVNNELQNVKVEKDQRVRMIEAKTRMRF